MKIVHTLYLSLVFWNLAQGSIFSCLNCGYIYNADLSAISSPSLQRALSSIIDSYSTTEECRTAAEEADSLRSQCTCDTKGKIPACVVYDGDFVFVANFVADVNFTASVVYRSCVEVDENYRTSCSQSKETEWTALPLSASFPGLKDTASAAYYTGSVCHIYSSTTCLQYSGGFSLHGCLVDMIVLFVLAMKLLA